MALGCVLWDTGFSGSAGEAVGGESGGRGRADQKLGLILLFVPSSAQCIEIALGMCLDKIVLILF